MKQGAHINQLEIENTKRVRAVTITPPRRASVGNTWLSM